MATDPLGGAREAERFIEERFRSKLHDELRRAGTVQARFTDDEASPPRGAGWWLFRAFIHTSQLMAGLSVMWFLVYLGLYAHLPAALPVMTAIAGAGYLVAEGLHHRLPSLRLGAMGLLWLVLIVNLLDFVYSL